MLPQSDTAYWSSLEANAHRPDVQEQIREAIRAGTIRVIPEGAGVKIVPTGAARMEAGVRSLRRTCLGCRKTSAVNHTTRAPIPADIDS